MVTAGPGSWRVCSGSTIPCLAAHPGAPQHVDSDPQVSPGCPHGCPGGPGGPHPRLCLWGAAVGTAPFLCLTSKVSAGKLSPAVCKHPFPLRRAACQAPPAASLARSRLTQAARPGTGLPPTGLPGRLAGEGGLLVHSRLGSLAAGLQPSRVSYPGPPHPVASAAVSGAVQDTPPCPPLGDTSGGIPERWGTRQVWEELRSPSRKQVSLRLGDRLPLEVRPVPGPQSRPHPWLALGSPPPAPGGQPGSQAPGVLWGVSVPRQMLMPAPTLPEEGPPPQDPSHPEPGLSPRGEGPSTSFQGECSPHGPEGLAESQS